jgi:hypothetical protein
MTGKLAMLTAKANGPSNFNRVLDNAAIISLLHRALHGKLTYSKSPTPMSTLIGYQFLSQVQTSVLPKLFFYRCNEFSCNCVQTSNKKEKNSSLNAQVLIQAINKKAQNKIGAHPNWRHTSLQDLCCWHIGFVDENDSGDPTVSIS